jgi:XTP/dITP diphosphohydrolase
MAQPALPLVAKILYRAEKYNVDLHVDEYSSEKATEKSVGEALASVIAWAHENGIDPENALRAQAREMIRQIQAAEQQGK